MEEIIDKNDVNNDFKENKELIIKKREKSSLSEKNQTKETQMKKPKYLSHTKKSKNIEIDIPQTTFNDPKEPKIPREVDLKKIKKMKNKKKEQQKKAWLTTIQEHDEEEIFVENSPRPAKMYKKTNKSSNEENSVSERKNKKLNVKKMNKINEVMKDKNDRLIKKEDSNNKNNDDLNETSTCPVKDDNFLIKDDASEKNIKNFKKNSIEKSAKKSKTPLKKEEVLEKNDEATKKEKITSQKINSNEKLKFNKSPKKERQDEHLELTLIDRKKIKKKTENRSEKNDDSNRSFENPSTIKAIKSPEKNFKKAEKKKCEPSKIDENTSTPQISEQKNKGFKNLSNVKLQNAVEKKNVSINSKEKNSENPSYKKKEKMLSEINHHLKQDDSDFLFETPDRKKENFITPSKELKQADSISILSSKNNIDDLKISELLQFCEPSEIREICEKIKKNKEKIENKQKTDDMIINERSEKKSTAKKNERASDEILKNHKHNQNLNKKKLLTLSKEASKETILNESKLIENKESEVPLKESHEKLDFLKDIGSPDMQAYTKQLFERQKEISKKLENIFGEIKMKNPITSYEIKIINNNNLALNFEVDGNQMKVK